MLGWMLAHPPSLAASLAMGARLLSLYGDNAAQDERAGQLIAVATEQGFPSYRAMGTIYRGWLEVNTGEVVGAYLCCAVVRARTARPVQNLGSPIISPYWRRPVRSPGKLTRP